MTSMQSIIRPFILSNDKSPSGSAASFVDTASREGLFMEKNLRRVYQEDQAKRFPIPVDTRNRISMTTGTT